MRHLLPLALAVAMASVAPAVAADEEGDLLNELQRLQAPPSGPISAAAARQLVDSTLPQVAKVMGLSPPASVKLNVVSREEARAKLLAILHRDYPGDALSRLGDLLVAVGLASPGKDLTREATAIYAANVSGFYDPHEKALYLLADQPMETQALIVAHELAHAIQDEHLDLDAASVQRRGSEDAQLAFSAAIEGQAQAAASEVMAAELTAAGLDLDGMAGLLSEGTAASASQAGAEAAVPWLGLQLSFPYAAGAQLVAALKRPDDKVARGLLRRVPESTAEVLAPEIYRRDEHPRQGALHLADLLPDSSPVYATTFGRANLDLFGRLHGGGDLGEGWRGDRAEAVRLHGRIAAAWVVVFGSSDQADRLGRAMASAVHGQLGVKAVQPDGSWYLVQCTGLTAVMLEGIPDAQLPAVQRAAGAVFRG